MHFGRRVVVTIDLALLLGGQGRVEGGLEGTDVEEICALPGRDLGGGQTDGNLPGYSYGGAALIINNAGIFRKSAGTGTTTIGVAFNNTGT